MTSTDLKISALRTALAACEHASEILYDHDSSEYPGFSRVENAQYELQMATKELLEIKKTEDAARRKERREKKTAISQSAH